MKNMITNAQNYKDRFYIALAMMMTAVCPTVAAESIWSGATSAISKIQTGLLSIVAPLAGLMALVALVIALTSSGPSFDRAISWLKRILVVFAAILCLGWIMDLLESVFAGGGL